MKSAVLVANIVRRHAVSIMIAVLALSALAFWGVSGISVITTQDAFISKGSEAYLGYQAYDQAFGGDSMLVLIPGDPLEFAGSEALSGMADLETELRSGPGIRSVVTPLTLFGYSATQSAFDPLDPESALQVALDDPSVLAQLQRFFPKDHALVAVRLAGGLTIDEQSEAANFVQETVAASPFAADSIVAGTPRMLGDIRSAIFSGLTWTGVIALGLMVLILFVTFPARWRLLSLPIVLLGVLWTFGVAAAAQVPLTLVTLAGLPVLIGLGVDFAIQFHNRYEEEMRRGTGADQSLKEAVSHIAPTMGVAVAVMILGFVTLLISAVPAVKDFGVLLGIGAAVLYLVALFVLNAFLYRFDRRPRVVNDRAASPDRPVLDRDWLRLDRALPAVARWSRRYAIWVVAVASALAVLGFTADRQLSVQTDIEKMIPSSSPGVIALNQAREVVGGTLALPLLIQAPDVTDPSFLRWMTTFQDRALESHPEITGVDSLVVALGLHDGEPLPSSEGVAALVDDLPAAIRDDLLTADNTKASLTFTVADMQMAVLNELIDDLVTGMETPEAVTVVPGGITTLSARTVEAFTENRGLVTGIGIAVVLLGLLAIYRNWRRALIAVTPIAMVTGWSSALMWVAGIDLNPLTAVLGALVIAIGTEFTVLLLSRYFEERRNGASPEVAMQEAAAKVGRAITASALTVAAGFGALIASSFPSLREFGIVVVVDVVFALVVTVTVVPALVRWLDRDHPRPDT